MKVRATVEIKGCDFDAWKSFYDSYEADRSRYIRNERVIETSDGWAEVVFEITDIEGLTELSKRQDIMDFEAQNGITVTINASQAIWGGIMYLMVLFIILYCWLNTCCTNNPIAFYKALFLRA